LISTPSKTDPLDRLVDVVRYFLSGFHIRPKGVKKPYNPVLGEFFRCRYQLDDASRAFFICEQVSHHPPCSTYFYMNPQRGLKITGTIMPKARFLGNSAGTICILFDCYTNP
jgi:hypothetical protein